MKNLVLFALVTFLLATAAIAQPPPIVTSASFLEWDYEDGLEAVISGFRIYMSRTPGVIPDGTSYVATIAYPTKEWPIQGSMGPWYAVATAVTVDGIESAPSNEINFFILEPPGRLRIRFQ